MICWEENRHRPVVSLRFTSRVSVLLRCPAKPSSSVLFPPAARVKGVKSAKPIQPIPPRQPLPSQSPLHPPQGTFGPVTKAHTNIRHPPLSTVTTCIRPIQAVSGKAGSIETGQKYSASRGVAYCTISREPGLRRRGGANSARGGG